MATKTFAVPKISCNHCVMTIKRELSALGGVTGVEGDVKRKEVTITFKTDADLAKIEETMAEIGYPIEKEVR